MMVRDGPARLTLQCSSLLKNQNEYVESEDQRLYLVLIMLADLSPGLSRVVLRWIRHWLVRPLAIPE